MSTLYSTALPTDLQQDLITTNEYRLNRCKV